MVSKVKINETKIETRFHRCFLREACAEQCHRCIPCPSSNLDEHSLVYGLSGITHVFAPEFDRAYVYSRAQLAKAALSQSSKKCSIVI